MIDINYEIYCKAFIWETNSKKMFKEIIYNF